MLRSSTKEEGSRGACSAVLPWPVRSLFKTTRSLLERSGTLSVGLSMRSNLSWSLFSPLEQNFSKIKNRTPSRDENVFLFVESGVPAAGTHKPRSPARHTTAHTGVVVMASPFPRFHGRYEYFTVYAIVSGGGGGGRYSGDIVRNSHRIRTGVFAVRLSEYECEEEIRTPRGHDRRRRRRLRSVARP